MNRPIIKENELVLHSDGCYSGYWIQGIFKAIKDIDVDAELILFAEKYPLTKIQDYMKREVYAWKDPKFVEFLVDKNLLERKTYFELHVGEYSHRVKPDEITVHEND